MHIRLKINKFSKFSTIIRLFLVLFFSATTVCCSTNKLDPYVGLSAKEIYEQGKEHAKKNKFSLAIKDFEALESNYPYGFHSDIAKLALIHAYYSNKDYQQAKAAADRFVRIYPNHKHVDYVYFMRGLADYDQYYKTVYKLFNIERYKRDATIGIQSFDDFKILVEKFPTSKYAADARQRMIHLRDQLAHHQLYIAKYYLSKEAYLAAVNRANIVISDFDETSATKEALQIMIKSYNALGMSDLEKNAINLLNNNFNNISSNSATAK